MTMAALNLRLFAIAHSPGLRNSLCFDIHLVRSFHSFGASHNDEPKRIFIQNLDDIFKLKKSEGSKLKTNITFVLWFVKKK